VGGNNHETVDLNGGGVGGGRLYADTSAVRNRVRAMSSGRGRELMSRKFCHDEEMIPEDETQSSFFAKVSKCALCA